MLDRQFSAAGSIQGTFLVLLAALALLVVAGLAVRDRVGAYLDARGAETLAARIELDLVMVRLATAQYTALNGGPEALSVAAFDDDGSGQGQVFDPGRTGAGRPVPPESALQPGARARYELRVADLTGGRGLDRVVVLPRVLPGVCQAYARLMKQLGDPLQPDPENRYPGEKGCTRGEDDDAPRIYTVLHRR